MEEHNLTTTGGNTMEASFEHHHPEVTEQASNDSRSDVMKRLKTAVALCLVFMVVEVVGGWLAGSLAVLSDAAHLAADLAAFAVAIVANCLASAPSTAQHTYGLRRTESLAALLSVASLAVVCVALAVEALRRLCLLILLRPSDVRDLYGVDGKLMSLIAFIGVLVNLALAWVLGEEHVHLPGHGNGHSHGRGHSHGQHSHDRGGDSGRSHGGDHGAPAAESDALLGAGGGRDHRRHDHSHDRDRGAIRRGDELSAIHSDEVPPPPGASSPNEKRNVNLHAAYLHVLGDLAQSVAVFVAGLTIWFEPSWAVVDPVVTLGFCALVFCSTLGVLRGSVAVLLEEVPPHVCWTTVHDDMEACDNVTRVHDLHIWCIADGVPCVSVHAAAVNGDCALALEQLCRVCRRHGLLHVTAQVQPASVPGCLTCGDAHLTCASRD